MDDLLYRDPDLTQFYDLDNGWDIDLDFCLNLASNAQSVLDLGCGTGLLASQLSENRLVVGADPAASMLEIARRRPGGDRVDWIEADARLLRLNRRFDLIVMTGHAFQVFLTDSDQRDVMQTIAHHLEPGGSFIFDSRNPLVQEWDEWKPGASMRIFQHPRLGEVKAWNDASHDVNSNIVTYQTYYQVVSNGRQFSADSQIKFTPMEQIASLLAEAGLTVDCWRGDWLGSAYENLSPEIIPQGRLGD